MPTNDSKALMRSGSIKYLVRLIVAVALMAYVFSRVPLGAVLEAMTGADPRWIFFAFVMAVAVQFLTSVRLKLLLGFQGTRLSSWRVFEINMATRFYGLFLPGGNFTAIAVRVLKLTRMDGNYAGAGVALLIDRLFSTTTLCVLGVAFWFLVEPSPGQGWLVLFGGAALALSLVVWLFLEPRLAGWLRRRPSGLFAGDRMETLRNALANSRRMGGPTFWRSCVLSVLAHAAGITAYGLVLVGLGLDVPLLATGWIRSVMLLITLIPISLAGLGLREAGSYLVLRSFGIASTTAVSFSLLIFFATVLGVGLFGGLLEARLFLAKERT